MRKWTYENHRGQQWVRETEENGAQHIHGPFQSYGEAKQFVERRKSEQE